MMAAVILIILFTLTDCTVFSLLLLFLAVLRDFRACSTYGEAAVGCAAVRCFCHGFWLPEAAGVQEE